MATYGFPHSLGLGDMNSDILQQNRQISINNADLLTKHQNDITSAVNQYSGAMDSAKNQLFTTAGEQFLTKGKAVQAGVAAGKKVVKGLAKGLKTATPVLGEEGRITILSGIDMTKPFTVGIKGTQAITTGEELTKAASTTGDVLGAGLQVGLAGVDIAKDISQGKIAGANTMEKLGNILDITAGALEAGGVAADLTGFAAPAGIAANILGGVIGLVGAGADLIGDVEEAGDDQTKISKLQGAAVPQKPKAAVLALGTTGAEVKQNIQA